ncbi:glutathione S-transferase C-terminal domain-containing protein [Microbulbifer sp.]|uniref:glutathione S-transferase C-terminal domain-containing protein n=1 Tax=Microbulbifer sp. TaxID=1908541 RepID=UPI00258EC54E|nr:glutathione S-transferase C-terminal domain-containing protein [Microbulbifer sp.]
MMTAKNSVETKIPRPTMESRLHLYLAWGCPFCHRILTALALTGLRDHVSYTWMRNIKGPAGWEIAPADEPLFGEDSLRNVYRRLQPGVDAAPSVPLLVDLSTKRLLSSDSAQITRFIATGMDGAHAIERELVPAQLVDQIDAMNLWLHRHVNRAVYEVGFATSQGEYERKLAVLFQSLDRLELRLAEQPYLLGNTPSESDLFLLPTLLRFDSVYHPLFKCCYQYIADYPALSGYLSRMLEIDGVAATYDEFLTKQHYFCSVMHVGNEVRDLNPSRLIPVTQYSMLLQA